MSKLIIDAAVLHAVGRAVSAVGTELEDLAEARLQDPAFGSNEVTDAHGRAAAVHATMIDGVSVAVRKLGGFTSDAASEFMAQDASLAKAAG